MSAPYARFFTPPLHGGSFSLPRARDVVKTSVFTRPRKRDSSKEEGGRGRQREVTGDGTSGEAHRPKVVAYPQEIHGRAGPH